MSNTEPAGKHAENVAIPPGLEGTIELPARAEALVLFAHGSGSGRLSSRNRQVAAALNHGGLATLLFDLLTEEEAADRRKVFDIGLLAQRLGAAMEFIAGHPATADLPLGLFGASTGAAAALVAAAAHPVDVGAVVLRGGRPDLAGEASLGRVAAPTLLIVGEEDREVLELNAQARSRMTCPTELAIVPGAGHLFEEPGALEHVGRLAAAWFQRWLAPEGSHVPV
ncbi:dienelactone hydrolase family protein [Falsiroseomonas oryziterrae]|uniref:dienelactone hydrolase family protein n=1 Tax=Falsiroseomonas oryziterrae TaxID=2911368 RepID=UPI001F40A695|nr:alpha/beta family hydrolase [Roseomonas sp. NPKOSM-4]